MTYKASVDNNPRCPLCKRPVPFPGSRGIPVVLSKNRFRDDGPTSTPQLLDCVLLSLSRQNMLVLHRWCQYLRLKSFKHSGCISYQISPISDQLSATEANTAS